MAQAKPRGLRLEALLDQRDRLRVKIGLAKHEGRTSDYDLTRSLARQSRALSGATANRQRADALQALARLYEKQAAELDAA